MLGVVVKYLQQRVLQEGKLNLLLLLLLQQPGFLFLQFWFLMLDS